MDGSIIIICRLEDCRRYVRLDEHQVVQVQRSVADRSKNVQVVKAEIDGHHLESIVAVCSEVAHQRSFAVAGRVAGLPVGRIWFLGRPY